NLILNLIFRNYSVEIFCTLEYRVTNLIYQTSLSSRQVLTARPYSLIARSTQKNKGIRAHINEIASY
ncbi:MAG: hypothetical protein LBC74_02620, partial [Planctomycetaceae bacterium]|nr:hypothetical protein [Planctomycetaceae bacterium]